MTPHFVYTMGHPYLSALTFTENSNGLLKVVSEYDQEIPQSQTADNPVAPRGRAAQPSPKA